MGNGKVLEGLSGPRRKKYWKIRDSKNWGRDAQIGVGTKEEELCITC